MACESHKLGRIDINQARYYWHSSINLTIGPEQAFRSHRICAKVCFNGILTSIATASANSVELRGIRRRLILELSRIFPVDTDISSRAICLNFGLCLHLRTCFTALCMHAEKAACWCVKYWILVHWHKSLVWTATCDFQQPSTWAGTERRLIIDSTLIQFIALNQRWINVEPTLCVCWECWILTSVDSDETVQPILETPNGVQSVATM